MIAGAQFAFFHAYFFFYLVSPSYCHRFVGYLEEEAVHTYTVMIKALDDGLLPHWERAKAPQEAIEYYNLEPNASYRDMLLAIRADEACHREVNHHFSDVPSYAKIDSHVVHLKEVPT
jgi:ubiquinol oxidase